MIDEIYKKELDRLRIHYVDDLRINLNKIKKYSEETLSKIESEGISGYYSLNADIHRYTSNAWRASWALGELKRLEELIGRKESEVKKKNKKKKSKKKEKK